MFIARMGELISSLEESLKIMREVLVELKEIKSILRGDDHVATQVATQVDYTQSPESTQGR